CQGPWQGRVRGRAAGLGGPRSGVGGYRGRRLVGARRCQVRGPAAERGSENPAQPQRAVPYVSGVTDMDSEQLVQLVQTALAEIDDRPVDVTARRTARIASLLGETEFAVYLGYELKPSGGHPPANAEDTKRLMADPSLWGSGTGPDEVAFARYAGQ